MRSKLNDAELVAACIEREAWAWDALVDRYKRLVYSIALHSGLGQDDAADVLQTVFTVLLENMHGLRAPQGLAAWLITTAKRASWSVVRKRQREQAVGDEAAALFAPAKQWTPDGPSEESRWADQAVVRDALERLGQRCRKLLWLLYYDRTEPTYDEVGRHLEMPVGSIGPTRARCLRKMRRLLQTMGMSPR